MKSLFFKTVVLFGIFVIGFASTDRIRVFAKGAFVGDIESGRGLETLDVTIPSFVKEVVRLPSDRRISDHGENPSPLRVLPLEKGESAFNASIPDRLVTAFRFAAEDVHAINRATREFLSNVIARADQFGAEFATSPGSRAALTSQTINKVRVTTLRAALADVIAPQITVGEVVVPDLSVPEFLTEPLEPRDEIPPSDEYRSTPFNEGRIAFLDRVRDSLVRLIAGQRLTTRPASPAPTAPVTPRAEQVTIPQTVLPTSVRFPEFVSESSFRAVPPPVAPAPREVVVVERHAVPSSRDLAPVAANLSAQIGSIAQALAMLSEQRNSDRNSLFKMISDTNSIGRLPSVTLVAPTISGTVSGLTDESIPDDITINTSGVLISSATTGTSTLAANFAAGTTTVTGILRVQGTGATSTFAANVDVDGNLRVGGTCISCGGVSSIAGWTDSGVLVELQTTSDLVAIGTSTPASGAVVTIEATTTGAIPLALRGYTGQAANFFRILNASGQRLMFVDSAGGIFSSSTLQAATTTIYGNLGVGTTSPSEQFSVAGRLYVGGSGTSTIENNLQVLGQLKIGTSSAYITDTQITGTSNFTISTQGENNHLALQTLGRVGVASGTPWGVLSVEHNGTNQNMPVFVIADEGTSTPTLVVDWAGRIMAGTSTPRGWFTINDRGGSDTFVVGSNTPHFIVKGGGNVGVGTSSPYALFSVGGNAALGTTTLYGSLTLGSASEDPGSPTNGQLYYSTTDGAIRAYTNSTWGPLGGGFTRNSSTGIVSLFNATDRLTIGTSSPAGLSLITAEATSTAAIPLTLRGYTSQAANLLQIVSSSGANLLFVNATGGVFASSTLQVTGNSLLYGSLGVATITPSAAFAVHGNALISGNITSVANVTATGTVTTANLAASASSTIDGLYVRLATTTYATTTMLAVTDLASTSRLTVSSSFVSTVSGTSTFAGAVSTAGLASSNGLTLSGGALLASSALGIFQQIGIGTTSPYAVLSVVGSTGVVAEKYTATSTTATSSFMGALGIGTTSPWGKVSVELESTNPGFVVANQGSSTPALFVGGVNQNGNVGIGTAQPANNLVITSATQPTLEIENSTVAVNSDARILFGINDGADADIVSTGPGSGYSNMKFRLSAAGYGTLGITALAMVGSGDTTLNMLGKLVVDPGTSGSLADNAANTALRLVTNTSTGAQPGLSFFSDVLLGGIEPNVVSGSDTSLDFFVRRNEAMYNSLRLSRTGDVGVSTTSPYARLSVWGSGTGTGKALEVVDSASTTRFVVQDNGFVGVGTTTPGALLSIHGNALVSNDLLTANLTATGTVTTANLAASASSTIDGLYARNATTTYATTTDLVVTGRLLANTGSSTITNLTTTNATATVLTVSDIASTSRLVVSSNSATSTFTWGIQANALNITSITATSTFANGIDLSGGCFRMNGTCLSGAISSVANSDGSLTISPTTGDVVASLNLNNANTWRALQQFNLASTSQFTATSSVYLATLGGNVGIGTTSPYAALSVVGSTGVVAQQYTATSTTATSSFMGALGIGTSTPAQQLSVAQRLYVGGTGTSTIENNLLVQGTLQTGTGSIFLGSNFLNFNQSSTLNFAAVATVTIPQTSHAFTFATSTSATPILAIEGSNFGRVGIGTSTATAKLAIAGGGLAAESLILANSYGSIMTPVVGSSTGYTVFSGGIGTGGADSIGDAYNNALRITHTGNLVNIGSIQGGELNLTNGGTFAAKVDYTTGTGPRDVAVGDVNGDGYADMVIANYGAATASVLLNNGNGVFAGKVDYTTNTGPFGVLLGDVNGDGRADIVTVNRGSNTVSVFLNNGNGTFATRVDYTTGSGAYKGDFGDVNGDGKLDIVTANYNSDSVSVLINNGNGTFAGKVDYTTGNTPFEIELGDVNGDGKADMVVTDYGSNYGTIVSVFINNGNGTFASRVTYAASTGVLSVELADVDGDGKTDIVTTNYAANTVSVLINRGNGTFATKVDYTTGTSPSDLALGDVNGDGKVDALTTYDGGSVASVFLNNGNGTFATRVNYTTGTDARELAIGDVNGDGKADIVATNYGSGAGNTISVLLNNATGMIVAKASSGNVGVGTSTPSSRLTIWGSGTGTGKALEVVDSASTTRFVVQDNGSVGIGTTSPWGQFSIEQRAGDGPVFAVGDQGTSSPHLVVAGNGYVGIGTSSPWSALSIEGRCVDTGDGCADFAELYTSSESVMPGEIVSADAAAVATVRKARLGDAVIGIVSSAPAITIEGSSLQFLSGANYRHQSERPAVALSGRVPVRVSTEGGAIRIGDRIAISSIPGVGMRATTSGMTVGVAIEAFDGGMSLTTDVVNGKEVRLGNATVFVNLSYAPLGESIGPIGQISQISPIDYVAQALSAMQNWLTQMGVVIEQSLIKVKEIIVDVLTAKKIVADQLQMKDKFTGEVYCVELVNGDLVRTKGECVEPNTTVNSIPQPDESAPLSIEGSPSTSLPTGQAGSGTNDFSATTTATTTLEIGLIGEIGQISPIEETATTTAETATTTPEISPIGEIGPIEDLATTTNATASTTPETQ